MVATKYTPPTISVSQAQKILEINQPKGFNKVGAVFGKVRYSNTGGN